MNSAPFARKRINFDTVIQKFFGSSALLAILILALITIFLVREGIGFFPQNLKSLRAYRLAGLEYVDLMRGQVNTHTALTRSLQAIRLQQLTALKKKNGDDLKAANSELKAFDKFTKEFNAAISEIRSQTSELTEKASAIKEKAIIQGDALEQREFLLKAGKTAEANAVVIREVNFKEEIKPIVATLPAFQAASLAYQEKVFRLVASAPQLPDASGAAKFAKFKAAANAFLATFPVVTEKMKEWDQQKPIHWYNSITSFVFGTDWVTNSFWQDFYGVVPLFTGSLMVAGIALLIAVPLGICAAIYVSEIATPFEANVIKPYIEFIAAIPSVVLGFFGIAFLGQALRELTNWSALAWINGFPIAERLNSFTAGCLLALMAVPTIFSLSEDALQSVPRNFKEASYALGATRFQTIFRVLIPASLSGIISACLLGFGRVVGETMVVLLCAGNRIEIPDFTLGAATLFQPVHTMTGIIAQEISEVARGTIHYRALFIVGLLLFSISLIINWLAQVVVRRYKISIG